MILIISNELDYSTNQVIDWLVYFKAKYLRINNSDTIQIEQIEYTEPINIKFRLNNIPYETKSITSYWYRKFGLTIESETFKTNFFDSFSANGTQIYFNVLEEKKTCLEFLVYILEKRLKIGSYYTAENNKLIHLKIAQSLNIKIPKTKIVSSKKEYLAFKKKQTSQCITKSISNGFSLYFEKKNYGNYTHVITKKMEDQMPEFFPPSLIQEEIRKKWEIRVFYLNKKFYSMAIFSQNDNKTKTDFRRYNEQKPNHFVPYKLPTSVEKKLSKFMKKANLNTGSIDLAYTVQNKYVFFEVNPVGQFGMVSHNCNYNLEKIIAKQLIKNDKLSIHKKTN